MIGLERIRERFYLPTEAWVLALTSAIWSVGASMANPYQSIYFYSVGANSLFIGYLLAVSSAVTALMQLIGGYVADVWGRRKVIVTFSFISAMSAFVYIFITQYQLLIIPILLASIAGVYGPAFNALLADSMQPELRARGIACFTLITSLPSVLFPYVGGTLMRVYGTLNGLHIAFFVSGLFGLVGVSYRALKLKETYSGTKKRKPMEFRSLFSSFFTDNLYILRHTGSGIKMLLIFSVLVSLGTGMTVPYTSLYVVNALGVQPDLYGILTNIAGLISVVLLIPTTRIVEKVGLRKSVIYASLSIPVYQLIFVRASGMDDLVAWGVLGSASNALLGPSFTALQANLSTQETRGRIMALFSVSSLVTTIPAQIFGGYLYNSLGQSTPFLASIPMFVLATIVLTKVKETQ